MEWDFESCQDICLYGLLLTTDLNSNSEPAFNPSAIRRVNEIFANPSFFVDGTYFTRSEGEICLNYFIRLDATSSDIVQGECLQKK